LISETPGTEAPLQGRPGRRQESLSQERCNLILPWLVGIKLAELLVNSGWNWSGAENEYRIALNLNPNCGECHFAYGTLLTALGRSDEAIAQVNQAIGLDPLSDEYRAWLAEIAYFSRQYDLAIKLFENLSDDGAVGLGLCYAMKKMYPEAIANSERGIARLGRETIHLGYLAVVYGLAGKKNETQRIISELKERSRHHYVFSSVFAYAYLGLGNRDQALTFLERAHDEQDPGLFLSKVSPLLDPLRSEPRFQALLRRMNFPE
jgi:tetratricopeptide (TPR) repeat protein